MEILKQRLNYAEIDVYKNYSKFDVVNGNVPTINNDDIVFKELVTIKPEVFTLLSNYDYIKVGPNTKNTKSRHFYIDKVDRIQLVKAYNSNRGSFFTTKDRHIKKHFANPFSAIRVTIVERIIKKTEDKLILKLYHRTRFRGVNSKYFRNTTHIYTLSFNYKNGNITCGETQSSPKKKSIRYRKNSFSTIHSFLTSKLFKLSTAGEGKETYDRELNNDVFLKTFLENFGLGETKINELMDPLKREVLSKELVKLSIDFLIKHKKIKVPNDYHTLMLSTYPGEQFLKKNDRKLIMSILDSYGLKSKILNKMLHENSRIDVEKLAKTCCFFGDDFHKYIGLVKPEVIQNKFTDFRENPTSFTTLPIKERLKLVKTTCVLTNEEKLNLIKIMNSDDFRTQQNFVNLFEDHFNMMDRLREYYPNIKMGAKTFKEFRDEHTEFSKLVSLIKKGWVWEYVYDNRMTRKVEDPIVIDDKMEFNPIILRKEEEYSEEGAYMHHCVGSYSDKTTSMIISLRLLGSDDRVTCEVNKKTGDFIQERYFCNAEPPENFKNPLSILKKRIKQFSSQRLLDHIEVKKTKIVINGIEVKEIQENQYDLFNIVDLGPHF